MNSTRHGCIACEGRKFGLGLVLASQRPSEVSPTVLSQCNTFLLHRLVNDRDQELVKRLVPDGLGPLRELLREARELAPHTHRIEVEAPDVATALLAIEAGADIVMLDNMPVAAMREAVEAAGGRAVLEASGGVNLDTVREIAATGVDLISVGALTHSAPALDISLEGEPA